MIDSIENQQLNTALHKFRSYIASSYDPDSQTAKIYLRVASGFELYAKDSLLSFDETFETYYLTATGVQAFERSTTEYYKRCARALFVLNDLYYNHSPKGAYFYRKSDNPASYQPILDKYQEAMRTSHKSRGTILTRMGRIKVFFRFLEKHDCYALKDITQELLISFISWLNGRYSSQSKASILYTIRNLFSYEEFLEQIPFDPYLCLTGLHSKKYERLTSFYTSDEIHMVKSGIIERILAPQPESSEIERAYLSSDLRQFCTFFNILGIESASVPPGYIKTVPTEFRPYIFCDDEIVKVIYSADHLPPGRRSNNHQLVYPVLTRLLVGTGMRIGETLALNMSDVDVDQGIIRVLNGKNGVSRYIPVSESLHRILRWYTKQIDISDVKPVSDA